MRNRRLIEVEALDEVANADLVARAGDGRDDREPSRITQGPKERGLVGDRPRIDRSLGAAALY